MGTGDLTVRNAYLTSRDAVVDVAVTDGTITAVEPVVGTNTDVDADGRRELDAAGNLVFPRFVDAHVHFDQALSATGERVPTRICRDRR